MFKNVARYIGDSQGVVGLNLVLSDKVFFSVDSGSLGHGQSESGGCPVISIGQL